MLRAATLTTAILIANLSGRLLAQEQIPWLTDLRQARQMAEQQQRLVLLHFWSESCPPCRALEQNVFNQPEMIRVLATGFIPVKINVMQQPRYADFYKIDRVPTDIVVDPSGRELYRATSPQNMGGYIAMLDQVRAQSSVTAGRTLEALAQNKLHQFKSTLPPLPGSTGEVDASEPVNGNPLDQFASDGSWKSASDENTKMPPIPQKAMVQNQFAMNAKPVLPSPAQAQTPAETNPRNSNPYFQASAATATTTSSNSNELEHDADVGPIEEPEPQAASTNPSNTNPSITSSAMVHPDALFNTSRQPTNTAPPTAGPFQPGNVPPQSSYPNNPPPSNPGIPFDVGPVQGPSPNSSVGPIDPSTPANSHSMPNFAAQNAGAMAPPAAPPPPSATPLALDGFCPVSLVTMSKWTKGDARFGAIHRGRTYFFASTAEQQRFLADPDRYSPALSGYDPVRFAETGQLVEGKREHGLFLTNSYYLFADEAALSRFESQPTGYVNIVRQAMMNARPNMPQR